MKELACVPIFGFAAHLRSLLNDVEIFGDINNLVVNTQEEHLFKPYKTMSANNIRLLDEVFDGDWYQRTASQRHIGETGHHNQHDFLVPIILFIDKTGTDILQRNGVEPITFTTPLIRRSIRNQSRAWRCIGFIPDLNQRSKACRKQAREKFEESPYTDYHNCLRAIVKSISDHDRAGIYDWLQLGSTRKYVRVRCPIAFIIGDGKSGDQICLRYGSCFVERLSRACLCPNTEADNTEH